MELHSGIIDDGAKLQIVPNTRKIVVPQSHKIIGTVGEHNSEQLTFQCPKTIDGHDIANCSNKYIAWTNAAGAEGSYDIEDVVTEGDNIFFPWVIESGVTEKDGSVSFSVHFEDKTEDGELLYHWGTTDNKECMILPTHTSKITGGLVIPSGYVKPTGKVTITGNGDNIDIAQYAFAKVDVPIPDGYLKPEGTKNISANGSYNVAEFESVKVNVSGGGGVVETEVGEATPTKEEQTIEPTTADFFEKFIVHPIPDEYVIPSGSVPISSNGTHNVAGFAEVVVNVAPKLQEKTVTANGVVTPDAGYDGLSKVTVNVPTDFETTDYYDGSYEVT